MSGVALAAWQWLATDEGRALRDAAASVGATTPAAVMALRKLGDADAVRAALELVQARQRAIAKFPDAAGLWCDGHGTEQASSARVAAWKAQRFAGQPTIDLCSGIGGDLMAIARVAPAEGVDRDPVRAWMAARNSGVPVQVADVRGAQVADRLVHIDPARRDERGARHHGLDGYEPGLDVLQRLWSDSRGGGAKLGPGIDLPIEGAPSGSELEFISEDRTLVQAVLWWGACVLHPGARSAAALRGSDVRTMHGLPGPMPVREGAYGACIAVPDPALERSGLAGASAARLGLAEAAVGLGIAHGPHPNHDEAWWWRWYRVEAEIPWRTDAALAWLRDHDAGEVTVKTRGKAVDPDALARAWRGRGARAWTVFMLRHGNALRAFATEPNVIA